MNAAFICDAVRTPFGRYGGSLSSVRTDDLAAFPLKALMERNRGVDWESVEDVIYGCVNQAGEDNRNVARMALLLAGLPVTVPGTTVNRLCGSSMDAVAVAARAIKSGEVDLMIAGGVESMSRSPYVISKPDSPFSRSQKMEETTIGWRFVNPLMKAKYGVDSMPETAENVAEQFHISREDQDQFAFRTQQRTAKAMTSGILAEEIVAFPIPRSKIEVTLVRDDEHPRPDTTLEALQKLRPIVKPTGTVTAGNSSGINDGACAIVIASEDSARKNGLTPRARIVAAATAGVEPRIMGFAPTPAIKRVLAKAQLSLDQMDVIELNEAFAAQALAVTRDLGLSDADPRVNPNGGAIALGHPLGASGARLITTATYELDRKQLHYALCSMCIGVGQGIALILERV